MPRLALGLILLTIGYQGYRHGYKPKADRDPLGQPH